MSVPEPPNVPLSGGGHLFPPITRTAPQASHGAPQAGAAVPPGYALSGHAAPAEHPAPGGTATANALGRVAFAIALAAPVIDLLITIGMQWLIRSPASTPVVWAPRRPDVTVAVIGSIVALTFGIAGLARKGAPRGLAGIAVGFSIATLLSTFTASLAVTPTFMSWST